jgi:O-antigen/teichoic acid export membrane protein
VVRYVSKYRAVADYQNLNQMVSTSLATFSTIGGLTLVLTLILSFIFGSIFKIPAEFQNQAAGVVLLVGINLALGFPAGVFSGILLGMERFDLNNIFSLVNISLKAILIVVIFNFKADLIVLGGIQLFASLLAYFLTFASVRRLEPNLKISFKSANRNTLMLIFQHGFFSFLLVVSYQVIYYSSSVLIGILSSAAMVTYFAMAAILVEYTRRAVNGVSFVLNPIASGLESRGDFQTLKRVLILGTKYSLLIIFPISLSLIFWGKQFFALWLGPVYAEKCYPVLLILLIPQIYSMSQFVTEEILLGQTKHKFLAFVTVSEAVLNLILSLILIKKYGIIGAALGVAIPRFLNYSIFSAIYIKQAAGISFTDYFKQSFVPPLWAVLPFVILLSLVAKFLPAQNLLEFIFEVALAGLAFLLLAWYLCFSREERKLWIERFSFLRM